MEGRSGSPIIHVYATSYYGVLTNIDCGWMLCCAVQQYIALSVCASCIPCAPFMQDSVKHHARSRDGRHQPHASNNTRADILLSQKKLRTVLLNLEGPQRTGWFGGLGSSSASRPGQVKPLPQNGAGVYTYRQDAGGVRHYSISNHTHTRLCTSACMDKYRMYLHVR